MRLVFSAARRALLPFAHPGAHRGGRAHRCSRWSRSPTGPAAAASNAAPAAGQGSRAAPGPAGLSTGARAAPGGRGAPAGAGAGRHGGGGLRPDHSAIHHRHPAAAASSTCMPRCCRNIAARGRSNGPSLNGETRTGVTTMRIDAGLDTGDMLLKAETEIGPDENAVELGARLAAMGADLLVRDARGPGGRAHRRPKSRTTPQATYAPLLKKEDGAHRLEPHGRSDPQSRARLSALARRIHRVSRPDAAHLEIAAVRRGERRRQSAPRRACSA